MLRARRRLDGGEAGTGLIGTSAATLAFLSFLLVAVHLLVGLYARSTIEATGYDAARTVAGRAVDHGDPRQVAAAERAAEQQARSLLGHMGDDARFRWELDGQVVVLQLSVSVPGVLPRSMAAIGGPRVVERRFVVRIEEPR